MLSILVHASSKKGGRASQAVWTYLIFFSGCIVVYQVGWMLNLKIPPLAVLLLLAFVTAITILGSQKSKHQEPASPKGGIIGLAAGLAVCLYVSLPIILSPSYANILRYSAKTGDDINHIAMIESDRATGGFIYSQNQTNSRLLDPDFVGYPQGWHINGALFESSFVKLVGSDSLSSRLLSYYLYKLVWLFIATYMSFELLATLLQTFYRQSAHPHLLAATAGILSMYILVSLFGYGFQNFIAAIGLVLAAVVLICRWLQSGDPAKKRLYITGLALMTAASFSTWVLPGVIVGLLALVVALIDFRSNQQSITGALWGALVAAALLSISQLYAVKFGAHGKSMSLNSGGATPPISALGVAVLLAATLAMISKRQRIRKKWLLIITALTSSEFVILASYQQLSLGSIRYYAIKLAFLTALVASLIFSASVIDLLRTRMGSPWLAPAVLVVLIMILPLVLGLDTRKSAYPLKDSAPITKSTAAYMLNLKSSDPNEIIPTGDKGQTYLATKLWSSARPFSSPSRQKLLNNLDYAISH